MIHRLIIVRSIQLENSNPDKTKTISFFDLIFIVAKRWKMIFFTSFGGALFIVLFAMGSILISKYFGPENSYLPNIYRPQVQILFQEEESGLPGLLSGGGSDLLSLMGGGLSGGSSKADLAELLLYRHSLLDTVIETKDIITVYELSDSDYPKQEARGALKEAITSDFNAADSTMKIGFEHYDPKFAEEVVLLLVELLEDQYKKLARDRSNEMVSFLDDSIIQAEMEMNEKLKEFTAFQRKHKIIEPLKQLEIKSAAIAVLENDIIAKRLKIEEISAYKGASDPQVKQAKNEIRQLERALQMQLEGKGVNSDYNIPISKLLEIGPEYNRLSQELNGLRELYINLRVQQQAKQLEMGNSSSTFQIIEKPAFFTGLGPGEIPSEMPQKAGPGRGKLCILFTFGVFFLAVLAAFILEFMEQVKEDPEEAEKLRAIRSQLPGKKKN